MYARKKIVIVGGGFGGLTAAQSLAKVDADITLIDKSNHHLFQPLLYQVASAGLSPAEIASPIRSILADQDNVRVVLDEVLEVRLADRSVRCAHGHYDYDHLILAVGVETSYFGHDEWERHAPGLKNVDDALEIRRRILLAFEQAERSLDSGAARSLLTFVVIGGGPTGVELAGAIAELSRFVLAKDFRSIAPEQASVVLIEAGDRILSSFSEALSESATRQLGELGVTVRTSAKVTEIVPGLVRLANEDLPASVVIWAAGVRASALPRTLGVPLDRTGRILVRPDLSIEGHPEVFAIGDCACCMDRDGRPLPSVSPVAMQQARAVASTLDAIVSGHGDRPAFVYVDKGSMATIGRSRAIAEMGPTRLSGFLAWCAWLTVHLWYLIGFRNRFVVMFNWFWSYVTYRRGARLITGDSRHDPTS